MKIVTGEVSVKYKDGKGSVQEAKGPVSYETFETANDVLTLLQTEAGVDSILSELNNSRNLDARAKVRAKILQEVEGPGKAIAKMVKATIAAVFANTGLELTEEAATARLKAAGVI